MAYLNATSKLSTVSAMESVTRNINSNIITVDISNNYNILNESRIYKKDNISYFDKLLSLGFQHVDTYYNEYQNKKDTNELSLCYGFIIEKNLNSTQNFNIDNYRYVNNGKYIDTSANINFELSYFNFVIPLGFYYNLFTGDYSINGEIQFGLRYYDKPYLYISPNRIDESYTPVRSDGESEFNFKEYEKFAFFINYNFNFNVNLNVIDNQLNNLIFSIGLSYSFANIKNFESHKVVGLSTGLKYML